MTETETEILTLDHDIGHLAIGVRTFNALAAHWQWDDNGANQAREGLPSIKWVLEHTEAELLRIPNFGRKSLNELKEVLAQYGWLLSGTPAFKHEPQPFDTVEARKVRALEKIAASLASIDSTLAAIAMRDKQ